jgi:hypothetical protein
MPLLVIVLNLPMLSKLFVSPLNTSLINCAKTILGPGDLSDAYALAKIAMFVPECTAPGAVAVEVVGEEPFIYAVIRAGAAIPS